MNLSIRGSLEGALHCVVRSAFVAVVPALFALPDCSKAKDEPPASTETTPLAKPANSTEVAASDRTESVSIVKSVCTEIVRVVMFAAKTDAAAYSQDLVSVQARGTDGATYHYAVDVHVPGRAPLAVALDIPGSIWDSQAYASFTHAVFERLGMAGRGDSSAIEGKPLEKLTNLRAEVIQGENRRVSQWLTAHPLDPAGHEQAALILGALGMRENCSSFFDTHSFCNRSAAHLAVARALRADGSLGDSGTVAELLIGLFIDTKNDCEQRIDALVARSASVPELKPWAVAARLRNRRDYRILSNPSGATLLERIELFRAECEAAGTAAACKTLTESLNEPLPDWTRMVFQSGASVDQGQQLTPRALALEFAEAAKIFPEIGSSKPTAETMAKIYNRVPGSVVNRGADSSMKIDVIDEGVWAMFLQRHLCHVMESIQDFLANRLGVTDEASQFKITTSVIFQRLTLFPLVSVRANDADWMRTESGAIRALIEDHPEWVPEDLWLRYYRDQPQRDVPKPDSWYTPALPPGTAYRFSTRHDSIEELHRAPLAVVQRCYELAPWQYAVAYNYYRIRAGDRPNVALFKEVLGRYLDYYGAAMRKYAELVKEDPVEYVAVMKRLAGQNPIYYLELGRYFAEKHRDKDAVEAYENAIKFEADAVGISNQCQWIVNYYADHGNVARATEIAKFAAEVYSYRGLETMGLLMERLGKLPEAEENFANIAERYNDRGPLIGFHARHAYADPSSPLGAKIQATQQSLFPAGLQDAKLADFQGPPKHGVVIQESNALLEQAGMKISNVIVALDGKRVDNFDQYQFVRALKQTDELDLIVWDGSYRAVHAKVPGRKFNLRFATYNP